MDNKARQLCRQSAFNLAAFPEAEKKSKREKSGSSMKVAQSLKSHFPFLKSWHLRCCSSDRAPIRPDRAPIS